MTVNGFKRKIAFFLINKAFYGGRTCFWGIKRGLLNWAGMKIGKGTKIVGSIRISGNLIVGENTWIGTGLTIHGNGTVKIGRNCDIAPDVTFLTGSHEIGSAQRRAGNGLEFSIKVDDGTWIGARSTIVGNVEIGKSCIIGACALVNKSFEENVIIAGIPASVIKRLE